MMPFVITLTGPSQCGKSEVIRILTELSHEDRFQDFHPVAFKKYTTREFRKHELEKIKSGRFDELDQRAVLGDDNTCEGKDGDALREAKIAAFKKLKCDLAYEQYGDRYGLNLADLYEHMKMGETPIVVLNDVRTVEDIKTKLGGQCFSIFIFREVPNFDHFRKIGEERNEGEETTKIRFEKASSIYRIYIENIHIFDKLILNVEDSTDSLEKILIQLIAHLCAPTDEFV